NRIPCSVGWNFTRVVPNGDVNGCLKAHRIPVGNINTDSFKNIWNSPAQRYFRKKTYTLEKKDRFFSMIGNDPRAAVGCFKGCDDLGRNEFLDRAVKKLSIIEKNLLKGIAQLCRFIDYLRNKKFIKGKKYEINTFPARALREKSFEPEQDLELRGIAHGYRAYKGPTHVVVDLTNRCNNTCLGCWMYSPLLEEKKVISSWAKAELSERDVIRLIKDLKDMGTEIIRFTGGGEPLLHKSFSKIVRFAKKSGLKVAVTTSLPYVHRSVIEALLLSDELAISLWAANADVYQLMHPNQSKKHFKWIEDTLRSIQTTANRYQEITLCHVLTNKNYKNVNEMITFAQKIGIRRLYFTLIDPIEGKTDTLLLNDNQRQWLYAYLQSVNGEQLNGVIIENYNGLIERLREAGNVQHGNYDGRVIDSLPCYIGWHFSRIVANGDVVPCCRGVKKRIGNIKEKRFKWIWNSLSQQEFRNNALRLSKFDPYFEKIECYKTCDNLMQNKVIHQRWISRAK
ncbi:MAG: SPASM domain-containing protein, partial [Candidatus Omnitrophica bacterium]|nr:SPASM domain-containing protein [Candidatus Omnitrophota bacterium]